MTAPSPYEIAKGISNNFGKVQQRQNDISAIDEILIRANQTGNPQDINNAMRQILSRVSPERQQNALALLQKKQADIITSKENASLKKKGVDVEGISDPALRHGIFNDEITRARAMRQAEASANVNYINSNKAAKGSAGQPVIPSSNNMQQSQPGQNVQNMPSANVSGGNLPQTTTGGQVDQVLNVNQLWEEGNRIASEARANGNPMTDEQGFAIAQEINNARQSSNAAIQNEDINRVASQRDYGTIAEAALNNVFDPANPPTDEMKALFMKKGEEIASKFTSEADIKKELAKEAKNLKNKVSLLQDSPPPKRAWTKAGNKLLDTGREKEQEEKAVKIRLKPLLDLGLYDTARLALNEIGYYPEEVENLITTQGENTKKTLAQLSPIKKDKEVPKKKWDIESIDILSNTLSPSIFPKKQYDPQDINKFRDNLSQVLKNDPSTNLILLRKSYEDKGIDWREFKNALDDQIISGQFALNDENSNQFDLLDEPPLDGLDRILFDLNLKGR